MSIEDLFIRSIPGILIGGLIGGGIAVTKNYFDRDKNVGKRLAFAPQSFDQDRGIGSAFLELQQYRPFSTQAFDSAGDQVDNILCLEKQIELGEVSPTMFHHGYAVRYARSANGFLQQMVHDVETKIRKRAQTHNQTPESVEAELKEIRALAERIQLRLQHHVKTIHGLFKLSDKRTSITRPLYQY
jgi:hypothetical protein